MHRYVAFLRAINVGGHTVKMDRLRALFAEMGFERVETFIASGNVVFDTDSADAAGLEGRIEAHLKMALGYEVATFLRTPGEVASAEAHVPFAGTAVVANAHGLYVGFLKSRPGKEAAGKLLALGGDVHALETHGRELYWAANVPASESKVSGATLEKALGMATTLRNITTVRKLAAKYPVAL
jgi:uncharacterized protein (DUF1697 family)